MALRVECAPCAIAQAFPEGGVLSMGGGVALWGGVGVWGCGGGGRVVGFLRWSGGEHPPKFAVWGRRRGLTAPAGEWTRVGAVVPQG